jgi:hypothetical protein
MDELSLRFLYQCSNCETITVNDPISTPEPPSLLLLVSGILAMWIFRRGLRLYSYGLLLLIISVAISPAKADTIFDQTNTGLPDDDGSATLVNLGNDFRHKPAYSNSIFTCSDLVIVQFFYACDADCRGSLRHRAVCSFRRYIGCFNGH